MCQLAYELPMAELRELATAAQPGAEARVLEIMSGPELEADIAKASEHAVAEACAAVWDLLRGAPEGVQARVRRPGACARRSVVPRSPGRCGDRTVLTRRPPLRPWPGSI
jgi:hypothetical protein